MEGGRVTIEKLQATADAALEFGLKTLREKGGLYMMFHLVRCDGTAEVMVIDPAITASEAAKNSLQKMICARVAAGEIEAVILVSDTYISEEERDAPILRVREAFGLTLEQAIEMGLMPRREAITVLIESPMYSKVIRQEYRRTADGAPAIELIGDRLTLDSVRNGAQLSGRFGGYPWSSVTSRTQ
jgi:hypothetical protein